jgi:arginine:pyruvate transaminase
MSTFNARYSQATARLDEGADASAWHVHERALERRHAGDDVILLCIGDPDFDTPPLIFGEALGAMRAGRTHYSPPAGEPALREAIAELESRTSPHPCRPEEVVVFAGATNALFAVMATLIDPGESIVVPEPMYVGYTPIFEALGIEVLPVPLRTAHNFSLDIPSMTRAVTATTRAMLINTPGNPAGNMIEAGQMAELAEFCREQGLWLICDEVYSMITFSRRHTSLRAAAQHTDNVVMVDALSKSHAMSGWRIGWTVSPEPLAERLARYGAAMLFGCSQFIQDAAAFALRNDDVYVEKMRLEYLARRDIVVAGLNALPGLRCTLPDAGMFVMVDVSGTGMDGLAFAGRLFDAEGVSTVPGVGFGPSARAYVRISLAQDRATLARALARIARFVATR